MIFEEELKISTHKKQSQQLISAALKKKRLYRCKIMLAEIKRAVHNVLVWSDEIFTVETVTSSQNDRLYARNAENLPEGSSSHLRRQKPSLLIVWAAVESVAAKCPLNFTDFGVKVNSEVYVEMLGQKCYPGSHKPLVTVSSSL
ncbi:uncharacterized protein LOC106869991 [Octopus bimaculoides]|uniref:uncharacterized protein LOC106869991 n=1 Tax=Octopus bimaculoides TaxID=37653 RepID=UPI00071E5887|nr:uncharacterized protein LOC106869991 [Octopus bimaculoides]|eukprot:XP_014771426.1 PREDICTED: uncharacterized protein LOC106869991 [Octopus bimaculoides]